MAFFDGCTTTLGDVKAIFVPQHAHVVVNPNPPPMIAMAHHLATRGKGVGSRFPRMSCKTTPDPFCPAPGGVNANTVEIGASHSLR